jgi:hypothetical protein
LHVGGTANSLQVGANKRRLARLNPATGACDAAWDPNPNGTVRAFVVDGDDLFVGGDFTSISGQARSRIARFGIATGGLDNTWSPGTTAASGVFSLARSPAHIYAGGTDGALVAAASRHALADGARDGTWNPSFTDVTGVGLLGAAPSIDGASILLAGDIASPREGIVGYASGATFTVPGAPQGLLATPDDGQASFTFSPPASNGGTAIIAYAIDCAPLGMASGPGSPLVVSGLTNGVAYSCTARATNAIGTGPASSAVNVMPVGALYVTQVASRKLHGAIPFDLPIAYGQPLSSAITIEPRAIGSGHQIRFVFNATISSVDSGACTDALGNPVGSVAVEASGTTATAIVTGIPEDLRVLVRLNNLNNTGLNVVAAVGFLAGDVDGSRSVTASDILRIKGRAGAVNDSSYLHDVDASGIIDSGDVSAAKARSGLAMH